MDSPVFLDVDSSTEKKSKMRLERQTPGYKRKQAIKKVCKTTIEKPVE